MVFLYGAPGVGKLTVATELSRLTGYKLFDNHTSIDWALRFFEFGQAPFWRLVRDFRDAVIEECAREGVSLVFTFVYAHDEDLPNVERLVDIVERHGGRVCLTQLTCDRETLEARVASQDRVERGKLSTVEGLRDTLGRYELFTAIPGRDGLLIDNTELSPETAALRIAGHFGLPVTG